MLTQELVAPYRDLLEADALKLDIVAYADCARAKEICTAFPNASRGYFRHFRLGGYKIFLDGSPQARTAWVRKPYADGSLGQSTMSSEDVAAAFKRLGRTSGNCWRIAMGMLRQHSTSPL